MMGLWVGMDLRLVCSWLRVERARMELGLLGVGRLRLDLGIVHCCVKSRFGSVLRAGSRVL